MTTLPRIALGVPLLLLACSVAAVPLIFSEPPDLTGQPTIGTVDVGVNTIEGSLDNVCNPGCVLDSDNFIVNFAPGMLVTSILFEVLSYDPVGTTPGTVNFNSNIGSPFTGSATNFLQSGITEGGSYFDTIMGVGRNIDGTLLAGSPSALLLTPRAVNFDVTSSANWRFTIIGSATTVPEPGVLGLLFSGFATLAVTRRRRRRQGDSTAC